MMAHDVNYENEFVFAGEVRQSPSVPTPVRPEARGGISGLFLLSSLVSTVFFFCGSAAHAQNSTFINYSTEQGLNHTQIFDITQDDFGDLWLMPFSSSIVYRFDGNKFERFLLRIPGVESVIKPYQILADGGKRILFLTNLGVVEYDGSVFRSFDVPENNMSPSFGSTLFLDSRSEVWVIDQAGFVFRQVSSSEMARQVLPTPARPLGFFEYENELFLITSGNEVISLATNQKVSLPWLASYQGVFRVLQDGPVYYIFTSEKLFSYNVKTGEHRLVETGPVTLNRRSQITSDDNGNLWLLSNGRLTKITAEGPRPVNTKCGFTESFVHRLFRDKYNSLWFCTDSEGLYHYIDNQPLAFFSRGEPVMTVLPLTEDNIICGTAQSGVMSIVNNRMEEGSVYKGLVNVPVTALEKGPDESLLVGTIREGMLKVDKKGKVTPVEVRSKIGASSIYQIVNDGNSYWGLSRVGLHRFDKDVEFQKSYSLYQDMGINSDVNFVFPVDTTSLLLGSSGHGLFRFYPEAGNVLSVPNFRKASVLYSMKRDEQKRLWFCGEFPFLLVLNENFEMVREIDLSRYCSNVWTLEFFNKNQLLIGSTDGVFRLLLDDKLEITSMKKLDKLDGHKGGEVFLGSMVRSGNRIWFGTGKGAYSYQIDNNRIAKKGPRTFIREVELTDRMAGNARPCAKGIYGLPENLKVNYGDTRLKFSFFANDFYNNQNTQYRYYLDGMETDWSGYSDVNQITYSNLKPGKYTFRVQSRGESMMLGSVADFPFEVLPAFWQTMAFKVLATTITFAALVLGVRGFSFRRLRQYRLTEEIRATEIARIRKQMAMDFHDEMGNKLAGILAYINSLKFQRSHVATGELVHYLEDNATAIYHGTKDFIWSIDMESNNLREVISYLRDFGVNFFEKHKIAFIIENDIMNTVFNRPLADGQNRHIILLFKEAMTNVLKHSRATKVHFDSTMLGRQCRIVLEDNGIGFVDNGKGKGIRSMRERAKRINGTVKIQKRVPRGTRVVLEFTV